LQVMNGNELESGRAAKCLFSADGGDIGHARSAAGRCRTGLDRLPVAPARLSCMTAYSACAAWCRG
jgi:hypothetical protein